MIVKRGDIWLAEMNPVRGSEQAGETACHDPSE